MAAALVELQLLATKQSILLTLKQSSYDSNARNALKPFNDDELAQLYRRAIDLDGNLVLLALESQD